MKIKKAWLIVLVPVLMSFQCDEEIVDDRFQTNLVVQNNTSFDLTLEVVPNNTALIPSQDSFYINENISENGFILPSEFEFLERIRLFKRDEDENLILVYEQFPIDDSLWIINESTINSVDHILIITDDLLID